MKIIFPDNTVKDFIESLEESTISKTFKAIDLLEKFGSELRMPYSKKISKDLFELRIRGKQEVRILYTFKGGAVLLHAFVKKTFKIPKKELEIGKSKLERIDRQITYTL